MNAVPNRRRGLTAPEGPGTPDEETTHPSRSPAPCSRCGGVEWRRVETPRTTAFRTWLMDGRRGGGDQEECVRCGQVRVSLKFGWRNRLVAGHAVGAPWRVIQALRENRSEEPVPIFYVGLVVAGTVVGVGLDLLVALPWWLVPLVGVAAGWLYFLSSAFRGVGNGSLGLDLRVALRPGRAGELHDEHTERVLRRVPFALLGLEQAWPGDRWVGGFGTTNGRVTSALLGHGRATSDAVTQLVVGVRAPHRVGESGMALTLRVEALQLTNRLGRWGAAWPPVDGDPCPDLSSWEPVSIVVDGTPVELRRRAEGDRWVAIGTVGEVVVTLEALRFPVDRVSLTSTLELEAYFTGAKKRPERETRAHPEA